MKTVTKYFLLLFAFVVGAMFSACGDEHEKDEPAPTLSADDIRISALSLALSGSWYENGDQLTISVDDVSYESQVEGVSLRAVKIMHDGKFIAQETYREGVKVSCTIDSWSHGSNSVVLVGVFGNSESSVDVEIKSLNVLVFDKKPNYQFAGILQLQINSVSENGEIFNKLCEYESDSQVISFESAISWLASDGSTPPFLIEARLLPTVVSSKTDFDCKLSNIAVHWEEQDALASDSYRFTVSQSDYMKLRLKAFVDLNFSGVHEGIQINNNMTVVYQIENKVSAN